MLGRKPEPSRIGAVAAGALVPDLPIIGFYAWQRLVAGQSEHAIWSRFYFEPGWQLFFDVFNSAPLALAGLAACALARTRAGIAFFASVLLHIAGDLPLHHDDAHRHFLPFTQWRFHSPLSYWDPRYGGDVTGMIEAVAVLACTVLLVWCWRGSRAQWFAGAFFAFYLAYLLFARVVWGGL